MQPNFFLVSGMTVTFRYANGQARTGIVEPKGVTDKVLTIQSEGRPYPNSYSWSKMQPDSLFIL